MRNCRSNAGGFQRSWKGNLTVLPLAKSAQTQETDGQGGNKEFTRSGARARVVRDFSQDFAQPTQVRSKGRKLQHQMPLRGFPSRDL